MPIAANAISYNEPTENTGIMKRLGKYGFTGTAKLPASNANCTVSNVGYVTDRSIIVIWPQATGQPLCEQKYNIDGSLARVSGDNGSFNVQTMNTATNGADQLFSFLVVNP